MHLPKQLGDAKFLKGQCPSRCVHGSGKPVYGQGRGSASSEKGVHSGWQVHVYSCTRQRHDFAAVPATAVPVPVATSRITMLGSNRRQPDPVLVRPQLLKVSGWNFHGLAVSMSCQAGRCHGTSEEQFHCFDAFTGSGSDSPYSDEYSQL